MSTQYWEEEIEIMSREKLQELQLQRLKKTIKMCIRDRIDSAFTSIYSDTLALLYANKVKDMFDELDEAKSDYENAKSSM